MGRPTAAAPKKAREMAKTMKILRGTVVNGVPVEPGDIIPGVSDGDAAELRALKKAELYVADAVATGGGGTGIEAPVAQTTETAAPLVGRGRPRASKGA